MKLLVILNIIKKQQFIYFLNKKIQKQILYEKIKSMSYFEVPKFFLLIKEQ